MPTRERKPTISAPGAPTVQRYRRRPAPATADPAQAKLRSPVLDVVGHGRGRPLDDELRAAMEQRLGASFDTVRLHVDARSTDSVDAKAYTVGEEIVVHPEFANLRSSEGRTLLAHELAHVIQQRRGPVEGTPAPGGIRVSDPADRFERAASAVADGSMRRVSTNEADARPTIGQGEGQIARPLGAVPVQRLVPGTHQGRRRELAQAQGAFAVPPIKVAIAGSGYGKWATTQAAPQQTISRWHRIKTKQGDNKTWRYEGLPDPNQWGAAKQLINGAVTNRPAVNADPLHAVFYVKRARKANLDVKGVYGQAMGGALQGDAKGTDVMFPGPGGPGTVTNEGKVLDEASGMWDQGSNEITKLTSDACDLVRHIVANWRGNDLNTPIFIKGHSRGAVAASLATARLRSFGYAVELSVSDPVPGPVQIEQSRHKIDLFSGSQATIVYSIASGHAGIFTPQAVFGAQRIIVTQRRHDAGVAKGFRMAGRTQTYSGSGLDSLPAGIYFAKFNGDLTEDLCDKYTLPEIKKRFKKIDKGDRKRDSERGKIIDAVLTEIYNRAHGLLGPQGGYVRSLTLNPPKKRPFVRHK